MSSGLGGLTEGPSPTCRRGSASNSVIMLGENTSRHIDGRESVGVQAGRAQVVGGPVWAQGLQA